jgi:hypothetical protein
VVLKGQCTPPDEGGEDGAEHLYEYNSGWQCEAPVPLLLNKGAACIQLR